MATAHPTYDLILKLIDDTFPREKLRILDYGCGDGYLLEVLPAKSIAYYLGCDINANSISTAQKRFGQPGTIEFLRLDRQTPSELESIKDIDLIILIGTLQYLSEAEFANLLHNAKRFLSARGTIIISCSTKHWIYRMFNLYGLFSPSRQIEGTSLTRELGKHGFVVTRRTERGLILNPFCSGIVFLIFDIVDKILFRNRGSLGPIGKAARCLMKPLLRMEYLLRIDYGYTLFVQAARS